MYWDSVAILNKISNSLYKRLKVFCLKKKTNTQQHIRNEYSFIEISLTNTEFLRFSCMKFQFTSCTLYKFSHRLRYDQRWSKKSVSNHNAICERERKNCAVHRTQIYEFTYIVLPRKWHICNVHLVWQKYINFSTCNSTTVNVLWQKKVLTFSLVAIIRRMFKAKLFHSNNFARCSPKIKDFNQCSATHSFKVKIQYDLKSSCNVHTFNIRFCSVASVFNYGHYFIDKREKHSTYYNTYAHLHCIPLWWIKLKFCATEKRETKIRLYFECRWQCCLDSFCPYPTIECSLFSSETYVKRITKIDKIYCLLFWSGFPQFLVRFNEVRKHAVVILFEIEWRRGCIK